MSTSLIPTNLTIPAHLANRVGQPSALSTSITGGIGGGDFGPRISIKGSRFRIVKDGAETVLPVLELDVVIVGANPQLSKTWYEKKWDPNDEPEAPDCSSLDGLRPQADSPNPQSEICATCKWNAWGSRVTDAGQKLKACGDTKRLAVVPANDPNGPVYLLSVTPAALKGLNQFQKELQLRGIAPEIVKTRIGFDSTASFPKLTFGFGGFLDEATQTTVDKLFGTDDVLKVTGEAQIAAIPKPAAPKPQLVKEKAVVKPEVDANFTGEGTDPALAAAWGSSTSAVAAVAKTTKATPKKEAPAVVAVSSEGDNLAKEIAAMLEGMGVDDTEDASTA